MLNRILSANPTNIDGTLLANGRVFFVNPAGVYIGNGARINVNQLVASALNISDADFINGKYNFAGGNGSVINSGDISAEKVYLIGKQVANSGNISCPAGYVVMAAGERVFLGEKGSDVLLKVEPLASPTPAEPADSGAGVLNEGKVEAPGGQIVLAAAGDIYSQAISNVGSLSVSAETGNAGQIKLTAPDGVIMNSGSIEAKSGAIIVDGSNIRNSGIIDASSSTAGVNAGNIRVTGDEISNEGTIRTNANAHSQAGNIDVIAQQRLTLEGSSLIEAQVADVDSSGGDIYLYSYGDAYAKDGQIIDISGGETSGDGGRGESAL